MNSDERVSGRALSIIVCPQADKGEERSSERREGGMEEGERGSDSSTLPDPPAISPILNTGVKDRLGREKGWRG